MPKPHPRPWRAKSQFGPGPRRRLDRNERARFRFLTDCAVRRGHLPGKQERVAYALLKRLGEDGQCDPSHATLEQDSGVSLRTVRRALERLAGLGMIRWTMRLVRTGWRTEQTSNAYQLMPGAELPPARCGGHYGRQTISSIFLPAKTSGGNDEWGRWNRDRQLAALADVSN